ncbi:phage portal protein [Glycomyces paridis]|uniref:phage portal protein n=1 Tax=Glycomyces paridis TaxID=2126555 RepID=UPI00195B67F2|nr:phage portal protein [Glycomyces paridis]
MAFVVSSGALTSLDRAQAPAPYTLQLADGLYAHYDEIWRTQPNVRTVVGFLARNIAQLGINVFRRVSDTDRERLTDHPLAALLANPQPGSKITRYRLIYGWMSDLGIYDSCVLVKVRGAAGGTAGLIRIPASQVEPIGDNWLQAEAYRITGTRGFKDVPADQVVHSFGYHPTDPRVGTSPLETLRRILAEEHAANTYREQLWRNGARTSGYIERPKDAPDWSDVARNRFRAGWRAQYTGTGPETGGTPVLEDGMKYVAAAVSPKDAEYISARKLTREEVAAAYYIPPPMVGILEHATFSNIKEQHQNLYQDTLGPWLKFLKEDIELQLLPDLDTDPDIYCEFNLDEKLSGSFEEQASAASAAVGAPWMTVNEQRARRNLPEIDGGDDLIVPMNVTVGGQASPLDSAPAPKTRPLPGRKARLARVKARAEEATPGLTALLAGFFDRQGRVLTSAVGAATSVAVDAADLFDVDRWNTELAAALLESALEIATAAGRATMAGLGLAEDTYNPGLTEAWLASHAAGVASRINAGTLAQLTVALAAEATAAVVKALFDSFVEHRAEAEATAEITALSGFAAKEAAAQTGKPMNKTWKNRTGDDTRPSHAALDGETVAVGDLFSNGARWPGDSLLPPAERAGCTCDMEIGPA